MHAIGERFVFQQERKYERNFCSIFQLRSLVETEKVIEDLERS